MGVVNKSHTPGSASFRGRKPVFVVGGWLAKTSGEEKILFRCNTSNTIVSGKAVAAAVGVGVGILAAAAIAMPSSSNGKEDTGSDDWGEEKTLKQGFKPRLVPDDLDIIVIGSGTGGLVLASFMAQLGKSVLVLEQHDQAGGNLHTFVDKGFEFDTGLHYVGEMGDEKGMIRKIFDHATGGKVEWQQMSDVYDRAVFRTWEEQRNMTAEIREQFDMTSEGGIKGMVEFLKSRFPGEEAAIEEYFRLCKTAAQSIKTYVATKTLPDFAAYAASWFLPSFELFHKTTEEVLSSLTSNRKLIGVLTYCWGDYGEPPGKSSFGMHALLQGHYCRKGSFYPVGGPTQISYNAVRTIERHGGKVLVRAPVTSIIIEGGKVAGVTLKDGDEIRAKQVVSTVGATKTFRSFVPIEHQHMVQRELEGIMSLLGETHGVSLGTLFLGLGEDCPPLPASNTWVFPSYDHDETVNSMSTSQPGEGSPILFISFGSAKDPTYSSRHGGKNSCMVCFPCDYSGVEKYADKRVKKRGAEYEEIKEKIKAKVLSGFLKEFPELEDKIEYMDVGTAVTNDYYLGTTRGAIYGLPHTPARFQAKWLKPQTPIPGLYLSGQDVLTCGVPSAGISGVMTAIAMGNPSLAAKFLA